MIIEKYRIADKVIEIHSIHQYVHDYCRDYRTEEEGCDFIVETDQACIEYEREKSLEEIPDYRPTDPHLEILAVYRQIAEKMPFYDTFLFHGSCIAMDGEGYLFTAPSGTGKSTHTRLWREVFKERVFMVNDDKPLIKATEEGVVVYGTPWNGKHRLGTNTCVPLKGLCILTRDTVNHIEPVSVSEALPDLFRQMYRPADRAAMVCSLNLLDRLLKHVRLYRLGCNMDPEAAIVAAGGMR
ncbi:MAG: hypothetical protein IKD69_09515 [Solobacterium sp.]|nr:hypothetical protein [Solobacterium sp.]